MKKLNWSILSAAALLTLAACADRQDPNEENYDTQGTMESQDGMNAPVDSSADTAAYPNGATGGAGGTGTGGASGAGTLAPGGGTEPGTGGAGGTGAGGGTGGGTGSGTP